MATFTDTQGRAWTILITVDAIKRVRAAVGVDLMECVEGKLLDRLAGDPVLLADVLYVLVKPEADAKHVTDEDFGRSLAGDPIDAAVTAFLDELCRFFPGPKRRLLEKAVAKYQALAAKAAAWAEEKIDSAELDNLLALRLRQLGDSSTSAPEPPAWTPAP